MTPYFKGYEKQSPQIRKMGFQSSVKVKVGVSCSVISDSFATPWTTCSPPGSSVHGILQAKNTGVGCHSLLQGIFLTQGLNLGLPHYRQILYCLHHQGSPATREAPIHAKK